MELKRSVSPNPIEVYKRLLNFFGRQNWWPIDTQYHRKKGTNPFDEIVIGAILTQNSSWKNVEKALERLKREGELSLKYVLKTSPEVLEEFIKPAGFAHKKTLYLKEIASFIKSLKGAIPKRDQLLKVKGIGPETADVILLYGYNLPSFIIDKYTLRWFERFYGYRLDYKGAKAFFENSLAQNVLVYKEFHALLDELGKNFCLSNNPRCRECPLRGLCRFAERDPFGI